MRPLTVGEAVSEALRYWEPRRVLYNLVLALVVLSQAYFGWPEAREILKVEGFLVLFILAVLANLCYCAAYIPDVFVQRSTFRPLWLRWRWALFLLGTAFAAAITYLMAQSMFNGPHSGD